MELILEGYACIIPYALMLVVVQWICTTIINAFTGRGI